METLRDRVGRLCSMLANRKRDLEEAAAKTGSEQLLHRILAQVRAGTTPSRLEHDLDALADKLAAEGVVLTRRGYVPLPTSSGHPVVYRWVCPLDERCNRVETLDATSDHEPVCGLASTPLYKVRLKT